MKNKYDPYKNIANQYDIAMGERNEISFLQKLIPQSHPKAKSILELGCGTGTLLKPFSTKYKVSGLDSSKPMLNVIKKIIPKGTFYHTDMSSFKLKSKYDIVMCLFNSLNHLSSFDEWKGTFKSSSKHLNKGGVFIFDINTQLALQEYTIEPIGIQRRENNTVITEYSALDKNTLQMHISIFTKMKDKTYKLKESKIYERSYPISQVKKELQKYYSKIKIIDPDRNKPNSSSRVLYFICRI